MITKRLYFLRPIIIWPKIYIMYICVTMKARHVHMEVVSLLMCIPPCNHKSDSTGVNQIVFFLFVCFLITNMHHLLVPSPLPQSGRQLQDWSRFGVHSETVTYRDTVTGREKIENKKTNLKIYIISFHIRTMHTTGNPPEKSHDCNINYTGIQRQY